MKRWLWLPISLLMVVGSASAQARRPLPRPAFLPATPEEVAQRLCEKVYSGLPFSYEAIFTEEFRTHTLEIQFRDDLRELIEGAGTCQSFQIPPTPEHDPSDPLEHADAIFTTDRGNFVSVHFDYDADGMVGELEIKDVQFPNVSIRTWGDLSVTMGRLPGRTSATARVFNANPVEIRGQEIQPFATAASLYVLKTLEEDVYAGRRRWTDRFPIREEWKSLPRLGMQTWPIGRIAPLGEFAEAMIRDNDNTAMDHLMHILGRANVEKVQKIARHHNPALNAPMLTTAEMFKIKWGAAPSWTEKYNQLQETGKREALEKEIGPLPLSIVGRNGLSMFRPTWIREVEWFGTTGDLCRTMESFVVRRDPTVLKILSGSTPFISVEDPNSKFRYAGFKGGSEPGVLTMSYLLLDRRGRWGCVSLAWSNSQRTVNQWIFADLVRKALVLYSTAL